MRSFQHDISQETRDKMSRFSEMHQELSAIIREHEGALRAPAIIKLLDTASTNLIYASGRLLGFDPSTVESVLHDGITAPLRAAADQLDQMRLTTS